MLTLPINVYNATQKNKAYTQQISTYRNTLITHHNCVATTVNRRTISRVVYAYAPNIAQFHCKDLYSKIKTEKKPCEPNVECLFNKLSFSVEIVAPMRYDLVWVLLSSLNTTKNAYFYWLAALVERSYLVGVVISCVYVRVYAYNFCFLFFVFDICRTFG